MVNDKYDLPPLKTVGTTEGDVLEASERKARHRQELDPHRTCVLTEPSE